MEFLRCASSRTTSSTDPGFTLTSMVSLKKSSTPLSWLFIVYTTVMGAVVGTGLGWLGRVGCTSWPVKSEEATFVKGYGVCIKGAKISVIGNSSLKTFQEMAMILCPLWVVLRNWCDLWSSHFHSRELFIAEELTASFTVNVSFVKRIYKQKGGWLP